jgi:hypothetical protein
MTPVPITVVMLAPANPNAALPRYGTPADWSMGVVGNDVDISSRSEPVVRAADGASITPYPIRTQTAKGAAMTPPLTPGVDIGIDYGAYAGQTGRTGTVTPKAPYPDQTSPPLVTRVTPNTGVAAGATPVTISGWNLTGATAVTFGGAAATAVVVVNPTTITATTPAHAAGTVDVQVTTPRGVSPVTGVADNFIYT